MQTDGYATDVPYIQTFFHRLAPAWLDHVAIVSGFVPPARAGAFAFCELGCGQGVTTAILAATHPDGAFYGIDAMPPHIEHARRFAAEAAISNVSFCAADFTAAAAMDQPGFDYIVAHGVYSWVNAESQAALRAFIDRHLKPGGLVYLSYNAIPGRASDLPFQRLVRALGSTFPGDSVRRYKAAAAVVRGLVALEPPALMASSFLRATKKNKPPYPDAYLAHEFMTQYWEPLCVTDVRAAMAAIGLSPAGSATLIENFDSLILGRAARKALAAIGDDDVRELARDVLINQSFRCDVFIRAGRRLDEDARRRRLRASTFALARPRRAVRYRMATPAGRVSYDNEAARAIVSILSAGPASLGGIMATSTLAGRDLMANVLVLCAAGAVWPVEGGCASVSAVNAAIHRRLGGGEEILYLALPCGTAVAIDDVVRRALESGRSKASRQLGDWQSFLAAHGVSLSGAEKR